MNLVKRDFAKEKKINGGHFNGTHAQCVKREKDQIPKVEKLVPHLYYYAHNSRRYYYITAWKLKFIDRPSYFLYNAFLNLCSFPEYHITEGKKWNSSRSLFLDFSPSCENMYHT